MQFYQHELGDEEMKEHQASLIIENYLVNEDKRLTLNKNYVPKLCKILAVEKVVMYIYLEAKVESMKRLQIFQVIPMMY